MTSHHHPHEAAELCLGRRYRKEVTMRRVCYSVAASLDGYIARPDGSYDWIPEDPAIDFPAFVRKFDTVLMGRGTFEVALEQGTGGRMPGMKTYVFSSTLRPEDHPEVTVVAEDAVATVSSLRQEEGKDVWLMGGGVLFRSLLEAGLVDRVEVGVVPVLLGAGLPLLPPPATTVRLELAREERFPSGIVLLRYEVRPEGT